MEKYKKQFNSSIIWYTSSSLLTQGFLIIHHVLLRSSLSSKIHGYFGCSLSLFYLLANIFNLGLNSSLISFFQVFSKSRKRLNKLIIKQIIPQIIIFSFSSVLSSRLIYSLYLNPETYSLSTDHLYNILIIIGISFFFESIRIFLSYFMKLAFYYRITSIIETVGMILYLLYIYLICNCINIYTLWIGHLINIIFQTIFLIAAFINFYYKLPIEYSPLKDKTNGILDLPSNLRIWKSRIFTSAIQISAQFFSGNFLVTACGHYINLDAASLFKIISSSMCWINIIFQKIFGISAVAVFAHIKNYNDDQKTKIFNKINSKLVYIILGSTIFTIINHKNISYISDLLISNSIITSLSILFILENFFILYEKWFILEEKAYYIFIANLINIGLALYILNYLNINHIASLLLIILISRILIFILLAIAAYYKWNIKLSFKINYKIILLFILISILFYAVF